MDLASTSARRYKIDLSYDTWHAHLAARTPSRLIFLTRHAANPTLPFPPRANRVDQISLSDWLTHLSGSGQRAA